MDDVMLRLVSIHTGDEVSFRDSETGKLRAGVVQGWREHMVGGKWHKQVMLAHGEYVMLAHIVSRTRHEGCGAGVLSFECA